MQETWLVTGGAGFIGGNFVLRQIQQHQRRIINLDKLTYAGNPDTLASLANNPDHIFVEGSIGDAKLLQKLFQEYQPDVVVNFAAESHVDRSIDGPAAFIKTNVVGTFELLQACLGYHRSLTVEQQQKFRLLHVSTDEVYGSLGETGAFSETTPYAPNSPYSASKASSDHLVRAYFHTYGLPVLTTNCSNNYGPYQFPEKLIPLMIEKALQWQNLPVYGDGSNVRDWLYVEDHCRAIETVIEKGLPGEVYNIGGNEERRNIEIVHYLCDALDRLRPEAGRSRRELIQFVADRPGHDQRYAIDAHKISSQLGWQPQETFDSGMQKTVSWYLDNQAWCERVKDGSYRGQRLGVEATL